MAEFHINDFSAVLISSDDDVNGRKNGLLRRENVELVLTFPNQVHTIFSKFLGAGTPESPQYQYAADILGNVFRSLAPSTQTSIGSGGSLSRAAFLGLYEYVLFASGAVRKRDDGTTATNLGQVAAVAPTVAAIPVGTFPTGVLNGDYQYIQINVFVNSSGGYRARSAASPLSVKVTA